MQKTLFIILLFFSLTSFAQKDVIKGRAFGVPSAQFFTLGLGYERMLDENFSAQILFNRMGYDMRSTDGGAEFYNFLIPEVRYFFSKKENRNFFTGFFTEFSKSKNVSSGEYIEEFIVDKKYYSGNSTKRTVAPGLLLGISNGMTKKFFSEFYLGGKYRFIQKDRRYSINREGFTEQEKKQKWGIRIGMNFGYRF